jgi:thioredoxin reductase (NADPH)
MRAAPVLDCIVVGGGAAGLVAAIYLARFRRRFLLFDGGASRLLTIPASHNYPGFASGVPGKDLLARLQAQAHEYGAPMTRNVVDRLQKTSDGDFIVGCGKQQFQARTVILATGVLDVEPALADLKRAIAAGHVRYCPICDGFEAIGKNVAVIGHGSGGIGEALFIRHFAHQVTLFSVAGPPRLNEQELDRLWRAQVRVAPQPLEKLAYDDGVSAIWLCPRDEQPQCFDVVYCALGTIVNAGLAQALGAEVNDDGQLVVDAHQQTSVDGLYAAGDVAAGLNQIAVAAGHAAIATTAIHNRLRLQ